jgi:hypothetical protein
MKKNKIMKWVRIVFITVSIILSLVIIYAIVNSGVSYKYEIKENISGKIDILWASGYLLSLIEWLKYFLYYIIITVVYLLISIVVKEKQ